MALVRYAGPDAVLRTQFGARPKGEAFELGDEEAAFVALHLPGHKFEPADAPRETRPEGPAARTKPAQAKKK